MKKEEAKENNSEPIAISYISEERKMEQSKEKRKSVKIGSNKQKYETNKRKMSGSRISTMDAYEFLRTTTPANLKRID